MRKRAFLETGVEIGGKACGVNAYRNMGGHEPTMFGKRFSGPRFASPENDSALQYSPPVPEPTARPPPGETLNGVVPSPAAPMTE